MSAEKKPVHRVRRLFILLLLLVLTVLAAVAVDAPKQLQTPFGLSAPTTVVIASGERLAGVLARLRRQDILSVRQSIYLRMYARLSGKARHIKAGEYQLQPGENSLTLLNQVVAGKVLMHDLQFIEGWRFAQAWQAVVKDPDLRHSLPATADPAAVMTAIGHAGVAAEGQFFPDTYHFPLHETDVKFLRRAYDEMQRRRQVVWADRAPDLPLKNADDALILASVIEKETAVASERPEIAGVFVRRLQIGMRLQTDPTVIYGMGDTYDGDIRSADLTRDTPYNTYIHAGLPPTPICLPGEQSLRAAVHPAAGKSLYFVAKGDGSHAFSDTLEQQDANVRRYQLDEK